MAPSHPYTAVSLYSGAGGLDAGFARYFDVQWAIDVDPFAVQTYNANIAPHAVCGDVLTTRPPEGLSPDLVIGGPPCQGFSSRSAASILTMRRQLVQHF